MQADLFQFPSENAALPNSLVDMQQRGKSAKGLDQYSTPEWFAELLVGQLEIKPGERVVDPGCGTGPFLKAIPRHADAVGIEIDAERADYCARNSGRPVIVGDFKTVRLPFEPTLFVGNPPFTKSEFDAWLKPIHAMLKEGEGRAAFILPAYHFQWARPVMAWHDMFSIQQQMIPREIFPGLTTPLNWVVFTKERVRRMWGFLFYRDVAEVKELPENVKLMLVHGRPGKSAWRAVVDAAIEANGGSVKLADIYQFVSGRRPSENKHWREQVRKVLYSGPYAQDDGERWLRAAA